ncbi:hypothetical protein Anapl_17886 [Anas platyrhynchos]|uniref:Uncharacterized protein n=1 Tax=Anas platyrhynchos TaxID=8839 RepID=R0JZQ5_ANAPL|nr:hypothetical protein Anapl_17886 [Anas platyrhynchos]
MAEARWHAVYLLQRGQFWKKRNSSGKRGGGVTPVWRAKRSSEGKELRCEWDGGVQDETQTLQIQNLSHVRIECDAVLLSAEGIDLVSGGLGYEEGDSSPKNRRKFIIIKRVVLDFPWHYRDRSADLCLLGGEIQSHVEDRFKSCACLNTTQCLRRNARSFEKHSFKGLSGTRVAQGPPAKDSVSTPVIPLHGSGVESLVADYYSRTSSPSS